MTDPAARSSFVFDVLDVQRDWPWIRTKLACHLVEDTGGVIARDHKGNNVAAIVLDSFSETACCCHIVVDNPLVLRHGFLQMAAQAAFIHAKRRVVIGLTPSTNAPALRFNKRVGWKEIYRIRDGVAVGVDAVVQEMRRETCRWLPAEYREGT